MVKHRLPLRIWAEPGYRITTLSRRSVFMLMANLVKEVDYGFEWKVVDDHHQEVFMDKHVRGLLWITSAGFSFWHSYPNPSVDLSQVTNIEEAKKAVETALCVEDSEVIKSTVADNWKNNR